MKKCFSNIRTLAALLMAGAAFAACSSDDNSIEQPANPTASKTYTLTVNASKGDASTRALALDGTKVVAKWADGDELYVYKASNRAECTSDNKLGTISTVASAISADGDQATFTGTLSGTVTVSTGDNLMLVYHPAAFAIAGFEGQAGTLASASNLDCATAQVTASVSGSDITIKETSATFTTHTAMLKLTLTKGGTTTINPTSLKMSMSLGSTTLKEFTFSPTDATYTANGNGVLYFALPSVEDVAAGLSTPSNPITTTQLAGVTITYTATVGSDTYVATKTGYTFAAATYYAGTLTMAKVVAYSSEMNVPAGDHWYIGGSGDHNNITIGDDATVTIGSFLQVQNASIICSGDATIILADGTTTNIFNGRIKAGPAGSTLTIKGNTGVLNIEAGNSLGAAIGASDGAECGNIVIEGGVITAKGAMAAGIGASTAECGDITISGGTVTATASDTGGAGIGSGYSDTGWCGNITISGGTVTATGGSMSAGIGTGAENGCGNITISGGTITATGGTFAAGIGGGNENGTCGNINITSDVTSVTATKGSGAPNNIGKGNGGEDITVTIDAGANVTATGHALSASAVGEIVGSDGKAYAASDKNNLPSGVTVAGLVAYKNGNNGLAIALTDEPNTMDWDVAMGNSGAKAHTPAVTGQTWKLPSNDDIVNMLSSYDSYWPDLNGAIVNVGGTGLLDGSEDIYWLSDESDESEDEARYMKELSDEPRTTTKGETYLVRSVIAF